MANIKNDTSKFPPLVVIEGNIGSGKSYLLEHLRSSSVNTSKILFVDEPVQLFENYNGHKPLKLLEEDPQHEATAVQLHIICTLRKYYNSIFKKNFTTETEIIICDRYFVSALIFIETLYRCEYISHFAKTVLEAEVKEHLPMFPKVTGVFFLDTPVELCINRIQSRARPGETRLVDWKYLKYIEEAYAKLQKNKVADWCTSSSTEINVLIAEITSFISESTGLKITHKNV